MNQSSSDSWPGALHQPQMDRKVAEREYDHPHHAPPAYDQLDGLDKEMLDEAHDGDDE